MGSTGIIKPLDRMSKITMTRINMTAARRHFMTVEHERNVVAAVVSTAEHVRNTRSKPRPLARASLQLFCYDDAAFLPLAKKGSAREQDSWARSVCDCRYRRRRNRRGERGSHC